MVPTFVATAAAYATVGGASISHRQRFRRATPVERMLDVPVTDVATLERTTVAPGMHLDEFVRQSLERRFRTFAVVNPDGVCIGIVDLTTATGLPPESWPDTTVEDVMREPSPVGLPQWTLHQALETMAAAQIDHLPILGPQGRLIGVVRSSEVLRLNAILDQIRSDAFRGPA